MFVNTSCGSRLMGAAEEDFERGRRGGSGCCQADVHFVKILDSASARCLESGRPAQTQDQLDAWRPALTQHQLGARSLSVLLDKVQTDTHERVGILFILTSITPPTSQSYSIMTGSSSTRLSKLLCWPENF
ncbi:hypothetical protein Dimus_028066 [Dionaea muscipula]